MRVAVEGHGYAGVSQKVLYEFRVNAALQKQGGHVCLRSCQRMGETGTTQERLEVAVHYVLSLQGGAYLCGENEAKVKESFFPGVRLFTRTPYLRLS